jgi:hypothetical protein
MSRKAAPLAEAFTQPKAGKGFELGIVPIVSVPRFGLMAFR